jgi:hypothetical protein
VPFPVKILIILCALFVVALCSSVLAVGILVAQPCDRSGLARLGEDVTEVLEKSPARLNVNGGAKPGQRGGVKSVREWPGIWVA